uniref:hypothetical protein n=1 Tax=Alistipes sp. TaxID=1872444 RepID=UPI0040565C92
MADKVEKIIEIHLNYGELQKAAESAAESLAEVNQKLKEARKANKDAKTASAETARELTRLEVQAKALKRAFNQYTSEMAKNLVKEAEAEGSIKALNSQIKRLTDEYYSLSKAERDAARGRELAIKIADIKKEVNEANEKLLDFRGNVGNYRGLANGFTPLNFQVQQLARELPSLTHSATQFFLAISNNLPMFTDELSKAVKQNKELQAAGKPTVSVFSQLMSSIFSWQTALVVGITLVTAYGDEIVEFAKRLFRGKESLDATAAAAKMVNETMAEGAVQAQSQIARLRVLNAIVQDSAISEEKRSRALKALRDEYPNYLQGLTDEEVMLGALNSRMEAYISNLEAIAKGQAAMRRITKNAENMMMLEMTAGYGEYVKAYDDFIKVGRRETLSSGTSVITEEYRNLKKAQDDFINALRAQGDEGERLADHLLEVYGQKDGIATKTIINIKEYTKTLTTANKDLQEIVAAGFVADASTSTAGGGSGGSGGVSSTLLSRLKAQTERLKEETFKITLKFIERQEQAELEASDRKRDHELAAIQEQIDAISAMKVGGVYEDGEKEVTITEEIYAELLHQREVLEEKKTATTEAYARERANIEKKYEEKAAREAAREAARNQGDPYKESERRRREEARRGKYAQRGENAAMRQYAARNPYDEIGYAEMGLTQAYDEMVAAEAAYEKLYSEFVASGQDYSLWADALVEANLRVEESAIGTLEAEKRLGDAVYNTTQETLQGFGDLVGASSELLTALGAEKSSVKALAIAQSGLAMASAIAGASKVGFPQSLAAIATVIAQFASILAQIRSINQESDSTFAQGGLIPVSSSSGIIRGRSHAQGGVAVSLDGRKVAEVEDGELLAVVNKRDTAQLQALSAINSLHGRKFASGGLIDFSGVYRRMNVANGHAIDTSGISAIYGMELLLSRAIKDGFSGVDMVVPVRDIYSELSRLKARDRYAKFSRKKD